MPAGTARPRRSSATACGTVRSTRLPGLPTGTRSRGSSRPMRLPTDRTGIHPRWDKIEHLFRACRHQIFFGTFPSEVRPEFVCNESLCARHAVLRQHKTPFRCPVRAAMQSFKNSAAGIPLPMSSVPSTCAGTTPCPGGGFYCRAPVRIGRRPAGNS